MPAPLSKCFGLAILLLAELASARAQQRAPAKGSALRLAAVWQPGAAQKDRLFEIDLSKLLSARQRQMVFSGFTVLSQIEVRLLEDDAELDKEPVANISCSVKYDLWDENFEIARLSHNPNRFVAENLEDFGQQCLLLTMGGRQHQRDLSKGGFLSATIRLNQVSPEKAQSIRQWLIRQQTGVMAGLFSNMLGDLSFSERVDVLVEVPPLQRHASAKKQEEP